MLPLVVVALVAAACCQTAMAAAPQPYGTNDAGGFRNVLPPGENGLDTFQQLLEFRSPLKTIMVDRR